MILVLKSRAMLTIKGRVHYVVKLSQQAMHQRTESVADSVSQP